MKETVTRMTVLSWIGPGRMLGTGSLIALLLVSACAAPAPVREADYPIDCIHDQPIKDLLHRGDVHRDFMMRERPDDNTAPERWAQVRALHASRARICYQLVLNTTPDHPYALLNMGFTHLVESTFPDLTPEAREKSLLTATGYIQQVLAARRLDAQAYYYLGEIAARRGQCDKAMRIFNALLTSRWSYSQVYAWIGYCDEQLKKPSEAREAYKKAAELANPIDIGEWAKSRLK
jgi:tetratricopeptide (TPR) repeat protein